jgi:hypothetical protein
MGLTAVLVVAFYKLVSLHPACVLHATLERACRKWQADSDLWQG